MNGELGGAQSVTKSRHQAQQGPARLRPIMLEPPLCKTTATQMLEVEQVPPQDLLPKSPFLRRRPILARKYLHAFRQQGPCIFDVLATHDMRRYLHDS